MIVKKLAQKHIFKGSREFEIVDDAIDIRIKAPFRKDVKLTVMLAEINPEPVIGRTRVAFTRRGNNEVLFSLLLANPDAQAFNAFVQLLTHRAHEEYDALAETDRSAAPPLPGNVYEEPPDFETTAESNAETVRKPVRLDAVAESIDMLSQYIGGDEIEPLLSVLEALQSEPDEVAHLSRLAREFDALGPRQGAVLTYAPYLGVLLSSSARRI